MEQSKIVKNPQGIAFSGKFCTGKDFMADALKVFMENYNYAVFPEVKKVSFAGELKRLAEFHTEEEHIRLGEISKFVSQFTKLDNSKKGVLIGRILHYFETIPTQLGKNRQLLQVLGTGCREIYPDIWIEALKNSLTGPYFFMINDMRFLNEVKVARELGFILVRLNCNERVRLKRAKDLGYTVSQEILEHPSENDLDNYGAFDYTFDTSNGIPRDAINLYDYVLLTKGAR